MGPPGGGQPSEAQRICLTFPAIREDVEKGAAGIRAAGERKAAREEVCPLFKSFAVKEAKLVSFLVTNQSFAVCRPYRDPGQAEPRQDRPDPQTMCAAPRRCGSVCYADVPRRAGRADHRRRHLPEDRTRHLRHGSPATPAAVTGHEESAMSDASGRVADATGNWVDHSAPGWLKPYLRLTRLDRPIGWGFCFCRAGGRRPWPRSQAALGSEPWHIFLLLVGAIVMRGAGCTWNDLVDRDIDAKVERTRSRPIPSGQVSARAALVFLVAQALVDCWCWCSSTASPSWSASLRLRWLRSIRS